MEFGVLPAEEGEGGAEVPEGEGVAFGTGGASGVGEASREGKPREGVFPPFVGRGGPPKLQAAREGEVLQVDLPVLHLGKVQVGREAEGRLGEGLGEAEAEVRPPEALLVPPGEEEV